MNFSRKAALIASLVGWVYSWLLFSEVRELYLVRDLQMPLWVTLLLGLTTTLLVGTAISAWMRLELWPLLSVFGGVAFLASVVGGQYSLAGSGAEVTLVDAFRVALRTRSAVGAALIAGVPSVLVLSALTFWLVPRIAPSEPRLSGRAHGR